MVSLLQPCLESCPGLGRGFCFVIWCKQGLVAWFTVLMGAPWLIATGHRLSRIDRNDEWDWGKGCNSSNKQGLIYQALLVGSLPAKKPATTVLIQATASDPSASIPYFTRRVQSCCLNFSWVSAGGFEPHAWVEAA